MYLFTNGFDHGKAGDLKSLGRQDAEGRGAGRRGPDRMQRRIGRGDTRHAAKSCGAHGQARASGSQNIKPGDKNSFNFS